MYKDFYDIFKKSLDINTLNYMPLSGMAPAVRNAVLALAPQGTITLENMDNFRVFHRGMPNVKTVFVFVDMRSIEEEQMHMYYTININNKRYAVLYRKFDELGDTEYIVRVIYCAIYHMTRPINNSIIDFTNMINEKYGEKISKSVIEDKDGLIQESVDVFAAYIISYYALEIGSVISYEDFINVFLNHIDKNNQILSNIIYRIVDFCNNYTIEQMLDEGLVALAVRSAVYGEDN